MELNTALLDLSPMTNDYNYTSSVTAMMRALEWESLHSSAARQEAKAVIMYNIVNSLVDIPPGQHLHPQGTAGPKLKFYLFPHTRPTVKKWPYSKKINFQ